MFKFIFGLGFFASMAGGMVSSAFALDVAQATAPVAIADGLLVIGDRSLQLPEGRWNLVAQQKGVVTNTATTQVVGNTLKVYAMDAKDGVFHNGVQLRLPIASFYSSGWRPQPCKEQEALFLDDFNSGFQTPECLRVVKKATHLSRPGDAFYSQAKQWATDEKVKLPGAVYEIIYSRFATNEFGEIHIWVPVKNVSGDDAIIAWAKSLPERLRRLFEKRENAATLPAIPSKL